MVGGGIAVAAVLKTTNCTRYYYYYDACGAFTLSLNTVIHNYYFLH